MKISELEKLTNSAIFPKTKNILKMCSNRKSKNVWYVGERQEGVSTAVCYMLIVTAMSNHINHIAVFNYNESNNKTLIGRMSDLLSTYPHLIIRKTNNTIEFCNGSIIRFYNQSKNIESCRGMTFSHIFCDNFTYYSTGNLIAIQNLATLNNAKLYKFSTVE